MLCVEHNKPVVYKDSDVMGTLVFKEVDKNLAKDLVIKNHYSHKWASNFGVVNVGVFRQSDLATCLGVASFGWMMFPRAYKSIASNIGREEILELNRLWVDDCLGKNTESMLLSASWKILKWYGKVRVVQSFADGRLGCGTIYKASNFKYYGVAKTSFLIENTTGEIWFAGMFVKTCSPKTMLELGKKFCKNELTPIVVNSYRYLYVLDKTVNILLKEQPYPEYQKGEIYVDKDIIFKQLPSTFGGETRGCAQGLFRDYIIGKVLGDEEACYYISKKLLEFYDETAINTIFNEQKENETLKQKFYNKHKNIFEITDWYTLLVMDSKNDSVKENVITKVDLWD